MFWGLGFIIFGIIILIYMRKDISIDLHLSKFFSKNTKTWHGNLADIVMILIGIAQMINSL